MWWEKWKSVVQAEGVLTPTATLSCFDRILSESEADSLLTSIALARHGTREDEYAAHERALLSLFEELYETNETQLFVRSRDPEADDIGGWVECRGKGAFIALIRASLREELFVDVALREHDALIQGNFDLLLPIHGVSVAQELREAIRRHGLHVLASSETS